jgi:hypothetical protein
MKKLEDILMKWLISLIKKLMKKTLMALNKIDTYVTTLELSNEQWVIDFYD